MEGVEEANKMALESCNRVLSVISQPQDLTQYRNLAVETEKAVSSFKRVVSLLSNGLGHARARIVKRSKTTTTTTTFHQNNLLESVDGSLADRSAPVKGLQQLKADLNECPVPENGSTTGESCLSLGGNLSNLSLERSSCEKSSHQIGQFTQSAHYQFLQQQQLQQQKLQFQHQLKHQNEMMHGRVNNGFNLNFDDTSCTPTMSNTRSFISSLSIDGSVTNLSGNGFSLMGVSHSLGQNSSQHKKRCLSRGEDGSVICRSSGRCHCAKKRKLKVRKSIKVPAISDKLADIPPDEYSWRKYGQKPIKGSPYPRGYYKCSTMKGCPAKKHVERCLEESSMLIVTYEDEHNHPCVTSRSANV